VSLLSDGTPRTVAEIHRALSPVKYETIAARVQAMARDHTLVAAAGYAAKPSNGTTARRYLVAQGVTA